MVLSHTMAGCWTYYQAVMGSTPSQVNQVLTAQMGDCLQTGKPSRYKLLPRSTQPSISPA